jgi:hypothetical protein
MQSHGTEVMNSNPNQIHLLDCRLEWLSAACTFFAEGARKMALFAESIKEKAVTLSRKLLS